MTGPSDHLRDYLHGKGISDAQITAAIARKDQDEAWLKTAAPLAMHIVELATRGDQDALREGQTYIAALQAHMREIDVTPEQRVNKVLHLLLRQTSEVARELNVARALLAERVADDQLRSVEGRTDYDYEQRIAEQARELAAVRAETGLTNCPQPCIHLSAHDAREGRTCPEHPCTCPDEAERRTARLLRDIDEAVEDYHHVFPPPAALAPNLGLAARAAVELRTRHEFCGILCVLRGPVGEGEQP